MRRHPQGGFTLIEVMVAILLMAIVSLVAWRGLDSVSRADRHVKDSTEQARALLRVFNQLERDLALRASSELAEPVLAGMDPPSEKPLPAVRVQASDGRPARLELIRSSAAADGLMRVRWWLQGGTLYRAAAPARDRFPLPAPAGRVAVLEDVAEFNLRVWEPGKGWRHLTGEARDNPPGLEIELLRQSAQGPQRYRQVLGPLN
ncbi:PulJ/GspJ family protein [Pseudomonas qingdaonensis]|uniref:PulJ/GspJ family protein n=1 Tax=Pseudomonas qingdaonensis TaxID=2056231 RepID=UPI000C28745D|nr:prepilin-type N-terminal cleavage/methylation domain-containing protein [Pseudomonas qingdaonensis]